MSRSLIACGVALLLAGPATADDRAELTAARRSLEQARQHLRSTGGGFGGHRQNAMNRVDQALSQVDAALAMGSGGKGSGKKKKGGQGGNKKSQGRVQY